MDYKYLLTAAITTFLIWIGYKVSQVLKDIYDYETDDQLTLPDMYCFQCEIEMPVKQKNGRLYCSNCGLYHIEDYSITEQCPHDISVLKVIESVVNCETTALFCIECNEQISEPNIECR